MDAVARAVSLEGTPALTAEQTTADLKIVVPPDLPPLPYDVAVRAEVLAADNKTVLAAAVTPARRLPAAKGRTCPGPSLGVEAEGFVLSSAGRGLSLGGVPVAVGGLGAGV